MQPFSARALALSSRAAVLSQGSSSSMACQSRTFATTNTLQTKTIKATRLPTRIIPPYPYGPRRIYKQSNSGLYGSARIRFGNNVSERYSVKTQRFWRPNVLVKSYYSPSIGANIKTRLTMRVYKTVKREGGLENYLLKSKPARIKELGPGGWNLRWLLMQTTAVQERFNEERLALGLDPKPIEDRSDIVQYALDVATPGPLSQRSKMTAAQIRAELTGAEFTLGNETLEGASLEVTDEVEESLLENMDEGVEIEIEAGLQAETPRPVA